MPAYPGPEEISAGSKSRLGNLACLVKIRCGPMFLINEYFDCGVRDG